jgi:hypothetical protein
LWNGRLATARVEALGEEAGVEVGSVVGDAGGLPEGLD